MGQIIGIDPGERHTGLVLFRGGQVQKVKLLSRKHKDLALNVCVQVDELKDFIFDCHGGRLAVEIPRIYPDSPVRVNDIIRLAFVAGALAGTSERSLVVEPRIWKGTTPKKIHNERILKVLPELREFLARCPKGKQEHIIDAAGLALWASRHPHL